MSFLLSTRTGEIYNFSTLTGEVRLVTDLNIPLTDIDQAYLVENGTVIAAVGVATSDGFGYQVDPNTFTYSFFANVGERATGLEFGYLDGQLAAFFGFGDQTGIFGQVFGGGAPTLLGSLPTGVGTEGDLEIAANQLFIMGGDGLLYVSANPGTALTPVLNVGRDDIEGLGFDGSLFYLFGSNGDYFTWDGLATAVSYGGNLDLNGAVLSGAASILEQNLSDSVPNFAGTAFDDHVNGTDGANSMVGGLGNDRFNGNGGDDLFYVSLGHNQVTGGDGFDVATVVPASSEFFIKEAGLGWTTIGWLKGSVRVSDDVEFVQFGDMAVSYADLATTLASGTVQYGWISGTYTDYGWYYEAGWQYGWRLGWNQNTWAYGWHVGWNYGWQATSVGWVLGWGVGWNVGWYFAPWSYGWGLGWFFQQGWQYGWNSYTGWHVGEYVV
ncbi:MAG: hypothetical protein AAFQ10_12330 [Pseudomonadota bacterium]